MNESPISGNILVTIIIPVFNGERYLKRCFSCLKNISFQNLQIIFVDDASSDNSRKLIEQFAREDGRIILISKNQNEGVSKARNAALKKAAGKYVFFFDCDDTFDHSIVSSCVFCAEMYRADAVLYTVDNIDSSGNIIKHYLTYEKDDYEGKEILNVVEKSFDTSLPLLYRYLRGQRGSREGKERNGPWRMMYKMEVIRKNGLRFSERLKIGEDTVFTNEYLCYCDRIRILREELYFLHINNTSAVNTYTKDWRRMLWEKIRIQEEKEQMVKRVSEKRGYSPCDILGGAMRPINCSAVSADFQRSFAHIKRKNKMDKKIFLSSECERNLEEC